MCNPSSLALMFLFLSTSTSSLVAQTISVDRRSALAALTIELNHRYGYLVTYEEGPFDATELREDTLANGKYLSPVWRAIEFRLPDPLAAVDGAAGPGQKSPSGIPPLTPEILDPFVKQYNESGNPGTFSVIYQGQYAHIVQVVRLEDGRTQSFEPILNTGVTFTSEARTCSEVLADLFHQVATLRKTGIVNVNLGVGGLWGRKCAVVGDNLTAREALEQILDQLGMNLVPGVPRNRIAWALMYDANWHEYFLSTTAVPDMSPHEGKVAPSQTPKTAAPVAPPGATSRTSKATPIKKD